MMKSLKGWILGVALCGATFSMHAQQSDAFVPPTNVKLSAAGCYRYLPHV